jgi:hypothetical protein
MLFRVAQWLGPIPIGWLLLAAIRGRNFAASLSGDQPETGVGGRP